MTKRSCRKCRFTLTELLVVIAIFAVLLSMLQPSLKKAMGAAEQTKCLSNLKQNIQGYHYFAEDNDGKFPKAPG